MVVPEANVRVTKGAPVAKHPSALGETDVNVVAVLPSPVLPVEYDLLKRPNTLGLRCDTITSHKRLVTTFISSDRSESYTKSITIPKTRFMELGE